MQPNGLAETLSMEAAYAVSGEPAAAAGRPTRFHGAVNAAHRAAAYLHEHARNIPADAHRAVEMAVSHVGYGSIAAFMALESTFLPIAAEFGLFPAGMEAAGGRLWWPSVLAAALAGSLVGSTFNYLIGRLVPPAAVRKALAWARAKPETVARIEAGLLEEAGPMVFFGRFIPGVRHVIAIVAGTLRVPLRRFYGATLAGELLYVPAYFFAGYLSGGAPSWWTLAALGAAAVGMSAAGILAARNALSPKAK